MIEKVFGEIQSDINWRNREFRKLEAISKNLSDDELRIFLKSIIPLIYAHWEGYIVTSLKIIFKYLNEKKLSSNDYCDIYLTIAYEQTLKSLDDSTGFDKRHKHLKNIYNNFNKNVVLKDKIDTKSNLSFDVLKEICKKIKIKINKFDAYKTDLNDLVNIRNSISHGENSYLFENFNEIKKYTQLIENLMIDFYSELQNLLNEKRYMREGNK